ncbi:sulfonate ABC transporter substrate-binding protein [Variovorax sp. KBW07]|uniref:aliphatic sulfonate ABC transporter substrate-binding protein n=1 Tax=Variovorax sp. KBW07 TaxID=2153358 RepID=UPI000F57D7A8|nr:aliphatic sulfonate ABC transporter substrate-binding protein [Variovorax sp. KBW07]RQO47200.1 sulfonate ABC transporter substrate-binding protein [Variovorax sp. KBW07]
MNPIHPFTPALSRRLLLRAGVGAAATAAVAPLFAQSASSRAKTLRIGYQKFNTLNILKGTGQLEKALEPAGVKVEWAEFLGGSQLSEALAAGAIDFGHASDGIGVFQQASGKGLVYLAAESPYPGGVGFLVPRDSPIRSVRDLKGKRVVTGRGYNTQYVLIRALEAAGLRYEDVEAVYITTASDTVAAYQSGSVAAIGLWDPFLAGAQVATDSRLLFDGTGLSGNRTYHFAQPGFARANQDILRTVFAELRKANEWAQGHPADVVATLSPQLKVEPKVLALATERRQYGVVALTPAIAKEQQGLADVFAQLKLIPKPIEVKDAFLDLNLV